LLDRIASCVDRINGLCGRWNAPPDARHKKQPLREGRDGPSVRFRRDMSDLWGALMKRHECICHEQEIAMVVVEADWTPDRIRRAEEEIAFVCPVHGRRAQGRPRTRWTRNAGGWRRP